MYTSHKFQKGSVSLIVIAAVSVTALVAGGVYSVNKLNKLEAENEQLSEVLDQLEEEDVQATTSKAQEVEAADSELVTDDKDEETKDQEVVYAPAPTPSEAEIQAEIDAAVVEVLEKQKQDQEEEEEAESLPTDLGENDEDQEASVIFDTQYVNQKIVEDQATSTGVFQISINISAKGGDVYIPITTTDSTFAVESEGMLLARGEVERNIIGFSYSVHGDEFRGNQTSKISCTLKNNDRCKIQNNRTSNIEVEVTIDPDESGSYSVTFEEITYIQNEEVKSYDLGESAGALHLR